MTTQHKTLAELLGEHRDHPTPTLDLNVPLLRLLDAEANARLTKKLKEVAGAWEVMLAKEKLWQALPKEPGVYMFVWRPTFRFQMHDGPESVSYVLYVGQAGAQPSGSTLRERYKGYSKYLAGHIDKLWEESKIRTRDSMLARYLKLEPLEFWYSVIPDPKDVGLLEDQLVKLFMPPLNANLRPKMRLTKPQPAFGGTSR